MGEVDLVLGAEVDVHHSGHAAQELPVRAGVVHQPEVQVHRRGADVLVDRISLTGHALPGVPAVVLDTEVDARVPADVAEHRARGGIRHSIAVPVVVGGHLDRLAGHDEPAPRLRGEDGSRVARVEAHRLARLHGLLAAPGPVGLGDEVRRDPHPCAEVDGPHALTGDVVGGEVVVDRALGHVHAGAVERRRRGDHHDVGPDRRRVAGLHEQVAGDIDDDWLQRIGRPGRPPGGVRVVLGVQVDTGALQRGADEPVARAGCAAEARPQGRVGVVLGVQVDRERCARRVGEGPDVAVGGARNAGDGHPPGGVGVVLRVEVGRTGRAVVPVGGAGDATDQPPQRGVRVVLAIDVQRGGGADVQVGASGPATEEEPVGAVEVQGRDVDRCELRDTEVAVDEAVVVRVAGVPAGDHDGVARPDRPLAGAALVRGGDPGRRPARGE